MSITIAPRAVLPMTWQQAQDWRRKLATHPDLAELALLLERGTFLHSSECESTIEALSMAIGSPTDELLDAAWVANLRTVYAAFRGSPWPDSE